jgi:ATP-dependent Clp protease ATP-binding subunit ClpA
LGCYAKTANWGSGFPEKAITNQKFALKLRGGFTRGKPIATSVEVPISAECKKVLTLAAEASERFGHRQVETGHMLIAILGVEASLAAQILTASGLKPGPIKDQIAKAPKRLGRNIRVRPVQYRCFTYSR